jgi:hypothetical protein
MEFENKKKASEITLWACILAISVDTCKKKKKFYVLQIFNLHFIFNFIFTTKKK